MTARLRIENLHVKLGDRDVLAGVSLRVAAGELVALLGPNGSGKTTLLRTALGHVRGRGDVLWNDRPLLSYSTRELSGVVAYMPQSPTLDGSLTVAELLRQGRAAHLGAFGVESAADHEAIEQAATRMELSDQLWRRLDTLSGGQRQRAALARALAQQPTTLVLDEPATFLDLRHQVELYKLLQRLAREFGVAVLMASHDLNLAAMHCDRLVLLHEGKIVADGAPNNMMNAELIQRVYGVEMRRIEVDGAAMVVVRG